MYRPGRSVLRSGTRLLWGILSLGSTVTLIGTSIPGDSLVAAPLTQDSDSTPNQSLQQLLVQESQGKSVDRVAALAKLRSADYEQLGTPDKDRSLRSTLSPTKMDICNGVERRAFGSDDRSLLQEAGRQTARSGWSPDPCSMVSVSGFAIAS